MYHFINKIHTLICSYFSCDYYVSNEKKKTVNKFTSNIDIEGVFFVRLLCGNTFAYKLSEKKKKNTSSVDGECVCKDGEEKQKRKKSGERKDKNVNR